MKMMMLSPPPLLLLLVVRYSFPYYLFAVTAMAVAVAAVADFGFELLTIANFKEEVNKISADSQCKL